MFYYIYYILYTLAYPLQLIWDYLFVVPISPANKIVIIGSVGGSGKTTLAAALRDHVHIRLDDCKYGPSWKRYPPDEFKANVCKQIKDSNGTNGTYGTNGTNGTNGTHGSYGTYGKYVIDGIYHDPKLPEQEKLLDQIIETADLVVWDDIPKWVALWRKGFRSFKRAIGVAPQGTAPEKWHNVKEMLWNDYTTFEDKHQILCEAWMNASTECCSPHKFQRTKWPYYFQWA